MKISTNCWIHYMNYVSTDEGLHEQMEDLVVNRSGAPATAGAPFFLPEPF